MMNFQQFLPKTKPQFIACWHDFFIILINRRGFFKKRFGVLNKHSDASTKLTIQLQVGTAADMFNCLSKYPQCWVLLTYLKYPKLCTEGMHKIECPCFNSWQSCNTESSPLAISQSWESMNNWVLYNWGY